MTRGRILPTRSLFVITNTNVRTRAKRPNSRSPRRRPSILPPAPSGSLSARQTDRQTDTERERERESVLCAENKDYYKHKQRARRGFLFVAGHETRNAKEPRVEIGRRRARRGRRILFCPKDTHTRRERERERERERFDSRFDFDFPREKERERERRARGTNRKWRSLPSTSTTSRTQSLSSPTRRSNT